MNGANIQCVVNKHGFILSIKKHWKIVKFCDGLGVLVSYQFKSSL